MSGVSYNQYSGFQPQYSADQNLVVQMLAKGDSQYNNGLSARQTLGANWQEKVAKGVPNNCMDDQSSYALGGRAQFTAGQ